MRVVEVAGIPVVVGRSESGEVCAIADTCTHTGGPLNEGARGGRGDLPLTRLTVRPVLLRRGGARSSENTGATLRSSCARWVGEGTSSLGDASVGSGLTRASSKI